MKNLVYLIIVVFLASSCSHFSMLGKRKVKVSIEKHPLLKRDDSTRISYASLGGVETDPIDQEFFPFQELESNAFILSKKNSNVVIKIEKEGYIPFYISYEKEKNKWRFIDMPIVYAIYAAGTITTLAEGTTGALFIPFVGIHHYLLDYYSKYKFPKKIKLLKNPLIKLPNKLENAKYAIVDSVLFSSNSITVNNYKSYKNYKKKKTKIFKGTKTEYFNEQKEGLFSYEYYVDIPNTNVMNYYLYSSNYLDSNNVIKDKFNTLGIEFTINEITKHTIQSLAAYSFSFDWRIVDYRTREIVHTDSDQITTNFLLDRAEMRHDFAQDAFVPYLGYLMDEYINKSEKKLYEIENDRKEELFFPTKSIDNQNDGLYNAMVSSVTVETETGHGSGFFISEDGYVITSLSNVAGKFLIKVITESGEEFDAKVIRFSNKYDLALLKITINSAPFISPAKDFSKEQGDDIFVIGTPKKIEFSQTLARGVLSGFRTQNDVDFIQTDAAINEGSSGGAMVDEKGNVLGVVNTKLFGSRIDGIGFVVHADQIEQALNIRFE